MNFKRLRGIASAAFATLAAALLAGCMNPMAGSVDGNSNARMATLSLSATGIPEEYAKEFAAYCERQNTSRSILPDDPFDIGKSDPTDGEGQSKGLIFVLTGKSTTGMSYGPEVVTLKEISANQGVYDFNKTITMESMFWRLTLTAYSDTEKAKAVLQGTCGVDLRSGSGTATFVMGIAGLTTPADVTIKGDIVDTSDASTFYTMGIYRKIDNKDVGSTETSKTLSSTNNGANETFEFNATNVPPGSYLYTMIFYSDNTKTKIVGSFTDTIVINPGNNLTKENLKVDVIGKTPDAPKDLKAYFVEGSQSSDGSTYNVKVTWTQAKYATNYEINVVESASDGSDLTSVSEGAAITKTGNIYGMSAMDDANPKEVKDFYGSSVFGADSSYMMYGDSSCVLKLETGKVYEIQLRARNFIGASPWTDRVKGTEDSDAKTTEYDEPSKQRINLMYVKYRLDNGKLKMAGASSSVDDIYVEYKCWIANDDLVVITPTISANAANDNTLTRGGSEFAAWLLEDGTAIKSDDTETTTGGDEVKKSTYKNAIVKASFGNKVTGAVSQEDEIKDVDKNDIKVMYGSSNSITNNLNLNTDGRYEVKKEQTDGSATWIQVSLENMGTTYKNVKFEVWGQSTLPSNRKTVTQTGTGQCQINLGPYEPGFMYVMVTAEIGNGLSVSQTITFELQ